MRHIVSKPYGVRAYFNRKTGMSIGCTASRIAREITGTPQIARIDSDSPTTSSF